MENMKMKMITMAHGSGGKDSAALMGDVFGRHFSNEVLDRLDDGAVLDFPADCCAGSSSARVCSKIE
jgi:hypothetical protein